MTNVAHIYKKNCKYNVTKMSAFSQCVCLMFIMHKLMQLHINTEWAENNSAIMIMKMYAS